LAGAAFAGSIANGYLWYADVLLPCPGYTITEDINGRDFQRIRRLVQFDYMKP
jgi:hypothetical protein